MFTHQSFKFLVNLSKNNDREWFNANKTIFKDQLETPFIELLEALTDRLADAPRPLSGGKSTMFRMNRDVRFSDDKSPYKTNISGLLTPSGSKRESAGLLYLQLGSGGGFVVAGYYNLSPKQLGPMRDEIIERADTFDQVKGHLAQHGRELDRSMALASMPRGFSQYAEHRHAEELRLKSLMVREDLPKEAWMSGDAVDRADKLARDAAPLLTFFAPTK